MFPVVKPKVPRGETKSTPAWYTLFPDMKHFVPRRETFGKLRKRTDYIPYSSILR